MKLAYLYDAAGNRVVKDHYATDTTTHTTRTYYVRDAQGNVMGIFKRTMSGYDIERQETPIYGSTRLGVAYKGALHTTGVVDTLAHHNAIYTRALRQRGYELTDHLGNVRATVSDMLIPRGGGVFDADLRTLTDYYPFGMQMPERTYEAAGIAGHRYGFNGKENDDDVKGEGNSLDFGARIYDPRVARWLSVDPKTALMPAWSPYATALDNPIVFLDPDGQYPVYFITRSYAPFKSFGPSWSHFEGDNRGHTLSKAATYRTLVSIMHDTRLKTTEAHGGSATSRTVDGSGEAVSQTHVENRTKKGSKSIDVHSFGNNAAQLGSWDIDLFTKADVSIEGNIDEDHVLRVRGTISGDDFPNHESMLYDSKGNTLWLGNYSTSGGPISGPVLDLAKENEDEVLIRFDVRIKVNAAGVFQGVMRDDEMISIQDWNETHKVK